MDPGECPCGLGILLLQGSRRVSLGPDDGITPRIPMRVIAAWGYYYSRESGGCPWGLVIVLLQVSGEPSECPWGLVIVLHQGSRWVSLGPDDGMTPRILMRVIAAWGYYYSRDPGECPWGLMMALLQGFRCVSLRPGDTITPGIPVSVLGAW
ncbi:hypothetical protein chiPu_0027262 [Chiloscyllium punctatum]|uniref:Uncharacterized protein n=1 Tax=Chiloscyllium punctatum TaxID=137246 RepID=A0A401TJX1_CHIPU|nr:hypothetical protein [Chiloscyllium punctatum]